MVEENATTTVKISDTMLISDLESLKVLADPLRLSILEYLMKPNTVKRIAEKLSKPPTKLYYHFNLLEQHNLIQLVDTRVVSGIIEKHYQATARSYQVARDLLTPGTEDGGANTIDMTLSGMFTDTKNDIFESIRDGVVIIGEENTPASQRLMVHGGRFWLTANQTTEFIDRILGILREYNDLSKDNENNPDAKVMYKALLVLHPSTRNSRDDSESVLP